VKKKFIFTLKVSYWLFAKSHRIFQESEENEAEKPKEDLSKLRKAAGCLLEKDAMLLLIVTGEVFWLA